MISSHAKKYIDKDPRRIFCYVFSFDKPRVRMSGSVKSCEICAQSFQGGKKRSCVACGRICCSFCCAKYFIPAELSTRSQDGLEIICLSCRDSYLVYKQEKTSVSPNLRPLRSFSRYRGGQLLFDPPAIWVPKEAYADCFQCGLQLGRENTFHNCRVCGELICNRCSVKKKLPECFERKGRKAFKKKRRVCLDCRFYLVSGILPNGQAKRIEFDAFAISAQYAHFIGKAGREQGGSEQMENFFAKNIFLTLENKVPFPSNPEYTVAQLSSSIQSPNIVIGEEEVSQTLGGDGQEAEIRVRVEFVVKQTSAETITKSREKKNALNTIPSMKMARKKTNDNLDFIITAIGRTSTFKKLKMNKKKVQRVDPQPEEQSEENIIVKELEKRLEKIHQDVAYERESYTSSEEWSE